ncbi:MAG: hypothetical protein QOF58_5465, partial [Pseudonocardiales bacterium]|nr:hypothetical protein [Pseudonocardiales bacterium]
MICVSASDEWFRFITFSVRFA